MDVSPVIGGVLGQGLATGGFVQGSSPTPTPTPTPVPGASVIDPSYVTRARATTAVAAGVGTTVISTRAGRMVQLLVTATGTGTGGVIFYDSIAAASGTVVGYIPATASVGQLYVFDLPVALGIVAANVANGPALTVAFR